MLHKNNKMNYNSSISLLALSFLFVCLTACQPKKPVIINPDEILLKHNFSDLEGNSIDIKQYLGKPLLINYWATWCKYCLKDLPVVKQFADYHKRSHNVILLSDESTEKIKQFKAKQAYDFIYLKSDKSLSTYGIRQRPAFAYFSAAGKHLETINGSVDVKILFGMVEYHKAKQHKATP